MSYVLAMPAPQELVHGARWATLEQFVTLQIIFGWGS